MSTHAPAGEGCNQHQSATQVQGGDVVHQRQEGESLYEGGFNQESAAQVQGVHCFQTK